MGIRLRGARGLMGRETVHLVSSNLNVSLGVEILGKQTEVRGLRLHVYGKRQIQIENFSSLFTELM